MAQDTPRTEAGGDGSVRDNVRQKTAGFANTAKEKVGEQFQQKVETATGQLSAFGNALRESARSLRADGGSMLGATALDMLADRVDALHGKVDGGDLDDVVQFIETFARRNSMAFVGTAFGLGFLAARFAKATSHRNHEANLARYDESFAQRDYGTGGNGRPAGTGREL